MPYFANCSPKVSIIIPVFNEARTIAMAVESAALQKTNFEIEILVVNDCSTDETPSIVERLSRRFPAVKVIHNERNSGKGFSFKRAYEMSRGQYFHVLDGDDCFVSYNKIQQQVEFLEANREYFAVGHNTLLKTSNGVSLMSESLVERDWSNRDCLAGKVYCHTSSLLFRKVSDVLPDYFLDEEFRGDTALFFYAAFKSGLMCKYLPNIWSIYNFHGVGLWSSLKIEEQRAFNVKIVQSLKEKIVNAPGTEIDRLLSDRLERVLSTSAADKLNRLSTLDDLLFLAEQASSKVFSYRDDAFRGMYAFRFVDELCEAAGRAVCLDMNLFNSDNFTKNLECDTQHAVLLVSGLVPGGGGVFREVMDLVQILLRQGFNVGIVSTHKIPTDETFFTKYFCSESVWTYQANLNDLRAEKLRKILKLLENKKPDIIFPFITHNDSVGAAAMQRPLRAKILFDFVYDHGLSLAVLNSSIDKIIVKTVSQARALRPMVPYTDLSLVPPFFKDKFKSNEYVPLSNGSLTSASAAARSYKVEANYKYKYSKIIPAVLKKSGGTHIHYGPLSDATLVELRKRMRKLSIPEQRFRHIPWAEDFGGSLIQEGVDLFIAPFPTCSARIAIEVMACGIPSVSHLIEHPTIPQGADFVDPQQPTWRNPRELLELVSDLDAENLYALSRSSRTFFEGNNSIDVAARKIFEFSNLVLPPNDEPEFRMMEFSHRFLVKLNTPFFRARQVVLPAEGLNTLRFLGRSLKGREDLGKAIKKKFWHRTKGRMFVRRQFHLMVNVLRSKIKPQGPLR